MEIYFCRTISTHTCGASLLIYSRNLSCNSPPTEFTELCKGRKGLPKPPKPLFLSSHGSEISNSSSYILKNPNYEFRTIWISNLIQIYLLLLTSVLVFNEGNCSVQFGREPRKTGFGFSVHLNTRRSRNLILPVN